MQYENDRLFNKNVYTSYTRLQKEKNVRKVSSDFGLFVSGVFLRVNFGFFDLAFDVLYLYVPKILNIAARFFDLPDLRRRTTMIRLNSVWLFLRKKSSCCLEIFNENVSHCTVQFSKKFYSIAVVKFVFRQDTFSR